MADAAMETSRFLKNLNFVQVMICCSIEAWLQKVWLKILDLLVDSKKIFLNGLDVFQLQFVNFSEDLRTIYSAIYMLGMLFGSYLFGWASDNFGRINALMMAALTVSLSGFFG